MDYILDIIKEHFGAAFTVSIIVGAAILWGLSWGISRWYKWTKGLDNINNRLDKLPCNSHESEICRHDTKIENVSIALSRIEGTLDTLLRILPQTVPPRSSAILSEDAPILSQKNSPKQLNGNGRHIFDIFGCDEFLSLNIDWLISEIDKFMPKTALDVENVALAALRVASTDDRFNVIKNRIYHSPAISLSTPSGVCKNVDITLDDVLFVMSLPLRDRYLDKHPEVLG